MNDYYTYLFTCPIRNEPIYVGKGRLRRAYAHLTSKIKHPFIQRIQWIRKQGFEPILTFLCQNEDEEFAFFCEEEAIRHYGRKNIGTGPLLNLKEGGDGGKLGQIPWNKGIPATDKAKAALSKSRRLRGPTLESTKQKLSKAGKNKIVLDSTKEKLSNMQKQKRGKKIYVSPEGIAKYFFPDTQPIQWVLKADFISAS